MSGLSLKIGMFFADLFKSNFLAVLFTSMFPIVEVRGGIPLGISLGMSVGLSYLAACLAGVIVVPILVLFLKKVINWMITSKKFGRFGKALDRYFTDRAKKVEDGAIVSKRDKDFLKYIALYAFVAAPLPMTGFWTGTAVAVFMGLKPLKSFLTITAGNLTAGGLVLLLAWALGDKAHIISDVFLYCVPVVLAILFIKIALKKKQSPSTKENDSSDEIKSDTTDEQNK